MRSHSGTVRLVDAHHQIDKLQTSPPSTTPDAAARFAPVIRTSIALLGRWTSDELVDVSAGITYWTVLSIFPALLAFTAMLGWLGFFIGEDDAEKSAGTSSSSSTTTSAPPAARSPRR